MFNFNTQSQIRAGKKADGTLVSYTGNDLVNSLVTHRPQSLTSTTFTLATMATFILLNATDLPANGIAYIDGSSEANGIFNGSVALATTDTIGGASTVTNTIGGSIANICPLLDADNDEVLININGKIGKEVFALLTTELSDGDAIVDSKVVATFVIVADDGTVTPVSLPAADYALGSPTLVYNFGFAIFNNIAIGGGALLGSGENSREELVELLDSMQSARSVVEFIAGADLALDGAGYGIKITFPSASLDTPTIAFTDASATTGDASAVLTKVGTVTPSDSVTTTSDLAFNALGAVLTMNGVTVRQSKLTAIKTAGGDIVVEIAVADNKGVMGNVYSDDIFSLAYDSIATV